MSTNPALDTKVQGAKSKTLMHEDYMNLIEAENLPEVVRYLKDHTIYGQYLKDFNPDTAHRADIEKALEQMQIDSAEKLLHYLQGADKQLLKMFLVQRDIQVLIILIRALAEKEDLRKVAQTLVYSEQYSNLPMKKLIESQSWEEFKQALKDTPYYRRLEVYTSIQTKNDLFQIEKSLERYYYDHLKKMMEKLSGKDGKRLADVLKSAIDLENLVWVYRGKKFYHLRPDTILTYSLLGGNKVTQQDIAKLSMISDQEELLQALKEFDAYSFLFDHDTEDRDLHMERRLERYMYYQYRKLLQSSGVAKAFAYLEMLRNETEDIISIIEGKRYSLSKDQMNQYLIYDLNGNQKDRSA